MILSIAAVSAEASAGTPTEPKNSSIDPWHIFVPEPVPDPVTSVVEDIPGSDLTAEIIYIEMIDGVYAPIAMMKPEGDGPFPLILLAHMNGGLGTRWLREWLYYGNWTPEQLVKAGYATAWMRYRAEVDHTYGPALKESTRQGRQLFNRGPFGYDDVISIVKYVKTLPYIDGNRIGYLGLSHGGEMLFKIASEYDGLSCGIANEPAAGEYLAVGRRPPGTPRNPETRMHVTTEMLEQEKKNTRSRIDMEVAMDRISRIQTPILVQGRLNDNNMPVFRLLYELARDAGKEVQWKAYEHPEHGFVFPTRNREGEYSPDAVQIQAVRDTIDYFDGCLAE